jgi:hypothetical protein
MLQSGRWAAAIFAAVFSAGAAAQMSCPQGQILQWIVATLPTAQIRGTCQTGDVTEDLSECFGPTEDSSFTYAPVNCSNTYQSGGTVMVRNCQISRTTKLNGSTSIVGSSQATADGSCITPQPTPTPGPTPSPSPCQLDEFAGTTSTSHPDGTELCLGGCSVSSTSFQTDYAYNADGSVAQSYAFTQWHETGASCGADTVDPMVQEPLSDGTQGVCNAGGVCVSEEASNCGYVNGEHACVGTDLSATNPCVTTASGAMFCLGSAPSTIVPDNGTTNVAAQENVGLNQSSGFGGGDSNINYFNSSTVNNSTNYGSDGGSHTGEGECGADSLQPCYVRIQEPNPPGPLDPEPDDDQARRDSIEGAANSAPTGSVNTSGIVNTIPTGSASCMSVTFNFFGNRTRTFPSAEVCDGFTDIKDVLGWIIALLVAFFIARDAIKEM